MCQLSYIGFCRFHRREGAFPKFAFTMTVSSISVDSGTEVLMKQFRNITSWNSPTLKFNRTRYTWNDYNTNRFKTTRIWSGSICIDQAKYYIGVYLPQSVYIKHQELELYNQLLWSVGGKAWRSLKEFSSIL
jgi:hypothetical protein